MKCQICKFGKTKKGYTQVVLTRKNSTLIFRNVPAQICDDCSEYYLDEETAKEIYTRAETCFSSGQEVAIIEYRQLIPA
ncbi:type II toxin-antitoxin system MqsA family antitoxin [Treponema sp. HNW]|uniref:type II toxin-antitoxin system MqsA family antitoxin n=1 Tax=unclassified Treponema TaxID=2638727 RepID=UPI003D13EB8D